MKNYKITSKFSSLRRGLGFVALTVAGLLAAAGAYAFNVAKGTYYYDNTKTQWENVYFRIGQLGTNSGGKGAVSVLQMKKMAGNENIYYYTLENSWDGAAAFQFSAVSGYTNVEKGIYDGNYIGSGQKSEYKYGGDIDTEFLFISTSTVTDGYVTTTPSNMPASLSEPYISVNGTYRTGATFNGSDLGVFDESFTLGGDVKTSTNDNVSATMHYSEQYSSASTSSFSSINMAQGTTASKKEAAATTVVVPEAAGQYSLGVYFQCGNVYENNSGANYVATYTVPGLTGEGYNFGSKKSGSVSSYDIKLTGVYGASTVSATLSNQSDFSFDSETSSLSTTVTIENNAGTLPVYFNPQSTGDKSADLTLSITYTVNSEEKTKSVKYTLSGYGKSEDPVCHIGAAAVVNDGPTATLNGYLQYYGCNAGIRKRGFVYTKSTSGEPTDPSAETTDAWAATDATKDMTTGSKWSLTTGTLDQNTTYKYKAYVILTQQSVDVKYVSTETGTFTTSGACAYDLSGDTIYFTIDKELTTNACKLQFQTFDEAIAAAKASPFCTVSSGNYTLNYNIVFKVVPYADYIYSSNNTIGSVTGGGCTAAKAIMFQDINNVSGAAKSLVVRCDEDYSLKPSLLHPAIRNSRNIVFDNLKILGSEDGYSNVYDNAIDIDTNDANWTGLSCGAFADANITIKNCYIQSWGFTCIHIAAYDGITFENNDIEASLSSSAKSDANTNYFGASIKMIQCENFTLLRNSFRGSHATSLWFQGVQGALVMNNVFWNSNDSYYSGYANNTCFIRLVTQVEANVNNKLGIYYNTFYIADNSSVTDDRKIDFFRLGSNYTYSSTTLNTTLNTNLDKNDKSTIRFMYNNCYSYDVSSVSGANLTDDYSWYLTTTESDWCSCFAKNNFWSKKSGATFAIPVCDTGKKYNINVEEMVCSTASSDPGDLIIKGSGLNVGSAIESDVSKLGAESLFNDRLNPSNGSDAVRKTNGEWTLGAYQQTDGSAPVTDIIWWGSSAATGSDWDNRANWRKPDGSKVTCVDNFAEDLNVILPAPDSKTYKVPDDGIVKYPEMPKFSGERTKLNSETVNAGQGVAQTPTKFANTIEIEYGGAIKGITNLADNGTRYYTEAKNSFEAGREEWILVGTVIQPFTDGDKGNVRLIQSADYFMNYLPHVYMRQAYVNDDAVNWNTPFASLEENVNYDKVFCIRLADEYGPYKASAETYYMFRDENMTGDGTVSKTYNFNGWFLNDDITPEYKVSGATLICNTYPANIDVASAAELNSGTVYYYDYSIKNFVSYDPSTGLDKEIKSQNGFMFVPSGSNDGYFRISKEMLLSTSTKYKSAVAVNPFFYLSASNANGAGGSVAAIIYDELKSDEYDSDVDMINKTIDGTSTQPEISVEMYGKELDKVVVPDLTQAIPLKLVCGAKMTVEFAKYAVGDMETVTLEDRETGNTYDLLNETASIDLAKGTYTGRFYLNLGESEEPIPTDVDDVTSGSASIDIYGDGKAVIISSSDNVILKGAEITDMAGRTTYVELTGAHYNKVNISGAQGVYVVKAIGDVMSETTKVIVK